MVSDQEIAQSVETLLRQSDPNAVTTLNGVVQQLEAKLGLDLTHKAGFIRDQISFILRSNPQPHPPPPPKDHFALQHHPQFQNVHHQIPPHFALTHQHQHQHQHQHHHQRPHDLNFSSSVSQPPPQQPVQPETQPTTKGEVLARNAPAPAVASTVTKESAPAKRRGGPGGLNKVCGVSPELQAVVGEPALPRTEIVKQLWAYIRKNNLQDPSNKRKIICDDALRLVFETDCTDMFKMNKLLSKHIVRLDPPKESGQAKRLKVDAESLTERAEPGLSSVIISEALSKFFGTGEREMLPSEALQRVWDYIKVNRLEDPIHSMMIVCDAKLQELLRCDSISALGIQETLGRHHLFKRS